MAGAGTNVPELLTITKMIGKRASAMHFAMVTIMAFISGQQDDTGYTGMGQMALQFYRNRICNCGSYKIYQTENEESVNP